MLIINIDSWKEVTCQIQLPLVLCYYNSANLFIPDRLFENDLGYSLIFLFLTMSTMKKIHDLNQFMSFIQLCNPILHLRLCHNFQTLSKILTTDLKSQVL